MMNRRSFIGAGLTGASLAILGCGSSAFGQEAQARRAQMVVYGLTPGGIAAAIQARRSKVDVVLVGGWREIHLGGMMSGGLGGTDLNVTTSLKGLGREVVSRINRAASREDEHFVFEPRFAQQAFDELVAEHDIPVVLTRGVSAVRKSGEAIEAFTTRDGQTFAGRFFVDASYEGDLLALAGVSFTVGRDAADEANTLDGFRGFETDALGSNHNFHLPRRFSWLPADGGIDPYRVEGDEESGLLPGVRTLDAPLGSADKAVQAYNFRLTMTQDAARRVDLATAPPAGFDPADYEILFRWVKAIGDARGFDDPAASVRNHLLIHNVIGPQIYDVNNCGAVSTDLIGGSWAYPEAGYDERETLWKAHERWIRGWFYAMQHHPDPRVPDNLRDYMRTYGWDRNHYLQPHPNDEPHWPYNFYVREARRMVSDFVMNGEDVAQADSQPLRSGRTIALGSYARDSHHVQRLLKPGSWTATGWVGPTVWNEGNFEAKSGGEDDVFAVPLDIVVPRRSECSNLLVTFCVSASHEAFGAIRMETTHLQIGQAVGALAVLALAAGRPAQDVPYADLHAAIGKIYA